MQTPDRRHFLATGALAGAAAVLPSFTTLAADKSAARIKPPVLLNSHRNKLALATYSYWHFTRNKYPIEKVIDHAAEMGVEGVDVLHMQMAGEKPEYLRKLKRHAFLNGVGLVGLSIHQGFVSPDKAKRQRNIDHTIHCMELAHEMGIPCIRLNTGRWGTSKNFDHLMANQGAAAFDNRMADMIPLGRPQTAADMGQAAVYLATAANVTGISLNVAGGFEMN